MNPFLIVRLITIKLLCILCMNAYAQPPFHVEAPDSFANPVLIVIPEKPVKWEKLHQDSSLKVKFYYVVNNNQEGIELVKNNKLTAQHFIDSGKIHVRGDATSHDYKKQFSVSLHKDPKEGNFLGMEHGGKHWVFNDCGAVDVTLMRNVLTFHMQNGMNQYAPHWKWFEVFFCSDTSDINNMSEILNNHYRGLYLLFDKIRFQKSRVKGHYHKKHPDEKNAILQINQLEPAKYYTLSWAQSPAKSAEVYEPKLDDSKVKSNTFSEIDSWYSYWAGNFNTIYQKYFVAKESDKALLDSLLKKIRKTTDYGSFATYFLINEIAKDQDGYHKSTFMVKRDSICYAGPLWDKNKSYGNLFNNQNKSSFYNIANGWLFQDNSSINKDANQAPQWWSVLLLDSVYRDTVQNQWNKYKKSYLDTNQMFSFLDSQITYLNKLLPSYKGDPKQTALQRNNACWQNGSNISMKDYQGQVDQLKSYLADRIKWMDTNLPLLLSDPTAQPKKK